MSRVAIIGGHGKVALHLTKILTDQGHQVSSIFRNQDHAADVEQAGATPVVADLAELSVQDMADVFSGHDAVVWSAGSGGSSPEATYAIDRDAAIRSMDAAEQASVGRYVMVSYLGAGKDHGVPEDNSFFHYAESKAAADEHLRNSKLAWTILGPGSLTTDPGTGTIEVSDKPQQDSVPREDVAHVAAVVLGDLGTVDRTIQFNSGPTPIAEAIEAAI
ncbi:MULTISPECIES: SDR family oxidoreductase [unclassified Arthrobacter]|uniref:SDR family oxidoreductase n=1 Tax=Arthrobacter sp. Leaf234 TaxID=1736303 RepID=UPI0006FA44D6|nr:SDR family oxidoreductase [Arthrobacter sp. Leaf234]KQO01630.1 NAD-dependent dehydratase [Arthrobacter sp. Leaf234]